jgi:CrcB protein
MSAATSGHLLAIAAGGAAGALLRYGLTNLVDGFLGRNFPWGILLVNVFGSLAIGLLYVWMVERAPVSDVLRLGLITGLLGALTTFSTFSLDTLGLLHDGRYAAACANIVLNVFACMFACGCAMWVARSVTN